MHSRICLLCASLLIGVSVYGQSLKINEVDKFSKEKKVYTSFEKISSESVMMVSPIGKNIWLRFAHDHGLDFAQLRWCSKEVLSVDSDADIVFLDKDGNTYNFKNKDYTLSTPGGGAVVAFGMNLLGVESWGLSGGKLLQTFDTDCAKVGVLICYDVEFPELSRLMADQGTQSGAINNSLGDWETKRSSTMSGRRCSI